MGHTPNRMEDHWQELKPLLKKEWGQLGDADLQYIDKEFDRLVEVIRQHYGGRVEIVQEASIRDRLNQLLQQVES
jgi:hypothetical protein